MPFLIALILPTLLVLLFYVGRMLFLAAGAPGGNFDAPSDPDYLGNLAEANTHGSPHAPSLTPHATSSHSHDSGSFDGGSSHNGH